MTWTDYDSSMGYWIWDVSLQEGRWFTIMEFIVIDIIKKVVEQAPNSTFSLIYSSKKDHL